MLIKAASNNLISGLFRSFCPFGIISMQYVDETLLFLESKMENVQNLKWLLSYFEQLSGMRINFHKCDLVPINVGSEKLNYFPRPLVVDLVSSQ
jgi:hypothetical protein